MSVDILGALGGGLKAEFDAAKDAQKKRAEEVAGDAFATALAQASAPANVATISGQRNNAVIPAVLVDLAANDAGDTPTLEMTSGTAKPVDPRDAFLDFARKSPAEQMRAMVLAEMGLSEDDLKNLSAEDRAALEAKIQIRIEAKVREEMQKNSKFAIGQVGLAGIPEAIS